MIKFEIEEISNGYLIKGDMGWYEDANGEFVEDFTIYAATLPDAFAMIANKCDQFTEMETTRVVLPDDEQDNLPF